MLNILKGKKITPNDGKKGTDWNIKKIICKTKNKIKQKHKLCVFSMSINFQKVLKNARKNFTNKTDFFVVLQTVQQKLQQAIQVSLL